MEQLRQDSDGYVARWDRSLSIPLSLRLARTPVTPNQITTLSLAVGLAGAWWLASADYWTELAGAALLWSCCILDGCDGEVARLKGLCSPAGARYDVLADNVVHLAIFAAIPVQLRRLHPGLDLRLPAAMLLSGVLFSMLLVWLLILRKPKEEAAALEKVYERIASRDFIYLVAALTVVRRLEWFLWAAGIGSHAFWISLAWISGRRRLRRA